MEAGARGSHSSDIYEYHSSDELKAQFLKAYLAGFCFPGGRKASSRSTPSALPEWGVGGSPSEPLRKQSRSRLYTISWSVREKDFMGGAGGRAFPKWVWRGEQDHSRRIISLLLRRGTKAMMQTDSWSAYTEFWLQAATREGWTAGESVPHPHSPPLPRTFLGDPEGGGEGAAAQTLARRHPPGKRMETSACLGKLRVASLTSVTLQGWLCAPGVLCFSGGQSALAPSWDPPTSPKGSQSKTVLRTSPRGCGQQMSTMAQRATAPSALWAERLHSCWHEAALKPWIDKPALQWLPSVSPQAQKQIGSERRARRPGVGGVVPEPHHRAGSFLLETEYCLTAPGA